VNIDDMADSTKSYVCTQRMYFRFKRVIKRTMISNISSWVSTTWFNVKRNVEQSSQENTLQCGINNAEKFYLDFLSMLPEKVIKHVALPRCLRVSYFVWWVVLGRSRGGGE